IIEMRVAVDEVYGFVVIVIVSVLVMFHDRAERSKALKERRYIIAHGQENLGHIAAPQPKIVENIMAEGLQLDVAFTAVQHGHAVPVFSDNVRLAAEIMLKITRAVITARSNNQIETLQALHGH